MVLNNKNVGVKSMCSRYEIAKDYIAGILVEDYGLTLEDAIKAINISPLEKVFSFNEDLAAHTSNEDWAKQVYDYYKKKKLWKASFFMLKPSPPKAGRKQLQNTKNTPKYNIRI